MLINRPQSRRQVMIAMKILTGEYRHHCERGPPGVARTITIALLRVISSLRVERRNKEVKELACPFMSRVHADGLLAELTTAVEIGHDTLFQTALGWTNSRCH